MGRILAALLILVGCVDTTQPPFVADVRVTPDSIHLSPGETAKFTATPIGSNGEPLPERASRAAWMVTDTSVAALRGVDTGPSVTVTARRLGTGRIVVTLGRGMGEAPVFVQPPGLTAIAIDPPEAVASLQSRPRFNAVLLDEVGAELAPEGFRISWSVEDEDIALPTNSTGPALEVFARGSGETRIRLVVGDLTTTARLVVQ